MKRMEKHIRPLSGYIALPINFLLFAGAVALTISGVVNDQIGLAVSAVVPFVAATLMTKGFFINQPNESQVLNLFGAYAGTVKENGFHWANPFYTKQRISLRARNHDGQTIKVNDHLGNPIEIAAVVVWKVSDTFKAAFEVDNYIQYVNTQSEAAVRTLAGAYPYDNFDSNEEEITLRNGGPQVDSELERALTDRLAFAGIEVIEARIMHLAYAQEIAGAMLQRQQATAVVAARQQIVEGAVGMVDMALEQLSSQEIVKLDNESKAKMVSNLLVVLCSDKAASPVVTANAA